MSRQFGFTLIEFLIAVCLASMGFYAVSVQVKAMKATFASTSYQMALDSFERYMSDYLRSREIIAYSGKQNTAFSHCLSGGTCTHGKSGELVLYLPGETKAISGSKILYDENAAPCDSSLRKAMPNDSCGKFYLNVTLQTNCLKGSSCLGADVTILKAEIFDLDKKSVIRVFVREMEQHDGGKFPNLVAQCTEQDAIMQGIGVGGEPLCVSRNKIEFKDAEGKARRGTVVGKPKDCLAETGDEQSFIQSISSDGTFTCSKKFW